MSSIADLLAEQQQMNKKLRNLGKRSCGKGKQQNKPSLTKQKLGELTARVHNRMDADRFPIKPENRQFRSLWQDGSATLIVQDTEFVLAMGSAPRLITEICWGWCDRVNGKWKTFETKIDHNMSVQELYNIYGGTNINYGSLVKVYGPPSDAQTEGITIEQLADCLEEIIAGQEIYLAEWSAGFCDYKLLLDSLERIGRANIMPHVRNTFSVLNAWRFAMTGVPLVFELSIIHELVMTFDFHLPRLAHRAKPDVLMTINVMIAYFKGTLNAQSSTGIRRYFKVFGRYDVEEDDDSGDLLLLKKPKQSHTSGETKEVSEVNSDFTDDWSDVDELDTSDFDDLDDFDSDNSDIEGSDFDKPDFDGPDFAGPDFDNTDSESNDDDGDIKPSPTSQRLPIDDGDGHSHRLVDNNASDGESITLAIAALTCGIARKGVMMNVASDVLQQTARFESYGHDFVCLTEPDRFLVPILLSKEIENCGSEDYDEQVPEPNKQHWKVNASSGPSLNKLPPKSQISSKAEEALQQKWTGGIGHFLLVIAERTGQDVRLTFLNSLPEYVPRRDIVRRIARNIIRYSGWMGGLWPQFVGEDWPAVAPQSGNTCGLHVVLNAWAYILSFNLRPTEESRSHQFYKEAREIINLALQGRMSVTNIEAWLRGKNFVVSEEARGTLVHDTDSELHRILQAHTVRMNQRIFDDFLETVHVDEKQHSYAANMVATSDKQPNTQDEHDGTYLDDVEDSDLSMEDVDDEV